MRDSKTPLLPVLLSACALLLLSGCSVRKLAVNQLAKSFNESSDVFTGDDDPQLVGDALPFMLKFSETLLASSPDNRNLLVAACSGFVQYSYGWVESEALRLETSNYRASLRQKERALKLHLRGRNYCLRALEAEQEGIVEALRLDPASAPLQEIDDLELLLWSGLSWGAAIVNGLDRPELIADLPAARALVERALEIEPDWGDGQIHEAMIAIAGLPEAMGGSPEKAKEHFERAVELSGGHRAAPYVTWASIVSVNNQDRAEYVSMLEKALAVDVDERPSDRLVNLITQERAQILLDKVDEYFF